MPERPAPPPPSRTARTLHSFLIASTLIVVAGAVIATRSLGGLDFTPDLADWLGLACALGALPALRSQRNRLPARAAGMTAEQWWTQHLGQAVLLWALLEGAALLGAVLLFLTGQVVGFAVLAIVALGGLFAATPGRLVGGEG